MNLAFFGMPGWSEVVIFATIGLLIFGKRLPEVGRSLGKGIVEFKKGLAGIEDDVSEAGKRSTAKQLDASPDELEAPDQKSTEHASAEHPTKPAP